MKKRLVLMAMLGKATLVAVLAFGLALVGCDSGSGDGGGGSGNNGGGDSSRDGDSWAILSAGDGVWIKEGETIAPRIKYEDMGGPGQYCYDDTDSQVGRNGQIGITDNQVHSPNGIERGHDYDFALADDNTILIISNWQINHRTDPNDPRYVISDPDPGNIMNGRYTKRY